MVVVAEVVALPTSLACPRAIRGRRHLHAVARARGSRDQGIGLAIAAITAGAGAAALSALIRRSPRRWWIPGTFVVVGYGAAMSLLAPILIAPRFNDFEELPPDSELRAEVVELGDRAGVDVGEVYRVDASRRSTALNAYVAGLGPTKRVVLFDTLIEGTDPSRSCDPSWRTSSGTSPTPTSPAGSCSRPS